MHVAPGDHRHLRRRGRQAVWIRERVVHTRGIGVLHQPHLHLPEPSARAFVERTVCDNAFRDTRRYRDGRLLNRGARRATAVMDLGKELQLTPWPARLAAAGILEEFGRRTSRLPAYLC